MGFFKELSIIFLLILITNAENYCPVKCTCKQNLLGDGREWIKVKCGEVEKVNNIDELDLFNIANDLVQLNLSSNNLDIFVLRIELPSLQKLDLSKNQLSILYDDQFVLIPNLRRLDLSGNNIKHIELSAFTALNFLEKLKLDRNQISTIRKGTFKPLNVLKQLDISNNPLTCDCELLWLLDWTLKLSVKLLSNPKCNNPFKGRALRKLKIGEDIHCKSSVANGEVPLIELNPNRDQIVFEGDSLKLNCIALSAFDLQEAQPTDNLTWSWQRKHANITQDDLIIENRLLIDQGIISSTLLIKKVHENHTGNWSCQLITTHGNHSKDISIVVITNETQYCPIFRTTNNKGSYTWPQTVLNNTVTTTCESLQLNNEIAAQKATYTCSENGTWTNLDTSKCGYISETTKILEQFSKVNLTLTKSTILESARHFKNYTSNLNILKDIMDLIFVIRTIENYLNYLEYEKELGGILLEITNNLLNLPSKFLEQIDASALARGITRIATYTPSQFLHKDNVALEEFSINESVFNGMTCTWYVDIANVNDRLFQCVNANQSILTGIQNRLIEASVQIPANIFYNLNEDQIAFKKHSHTLIIVMYRNSNFFPVKTENKEIASSVVGVQLVDYPSITLTEPIYVLLKSPPILSYETALPIPVWWDIQLNNGTGGWSPEGCQISHNIEDNLVIKCNRIGYYGLLQNTPNVIETTRSGAPFRLSHPSVYVGSSVLCLCLFTCILTYLLSYNSIQMPKKMKHSLINTWMSSIFVCFVYVFGIYQTEEAHLCQIIGLTLHYFTLCALLWMCVSVNSMYKRLRKNDTSIQLQDDELQPEERIQKPILGLYLVGWGIALIICGISGAINMKEYASYTYCFLNSGPALSAIFIPIGVLLAFLTVHFLLIRCHVYSVDTNGHLSEGTQAIDLDLLEQPNFPNAEESRSVAASVSSKSSSEIDDPEHAPMTQLKAHVIYLVFFLLSWSSCASATIKPIKIAHEEDIFSIVYAVLASILGVFTLFFYCIARSDVRKEWLVLSKSFTRKKCFRSRNISDTNHGVSPLTIPPPPTRAIGDVQIVSRSTSRSSSRTKSQSNATDLNKTAPPDTASKINNVLALHRQQYIIPNIIENRTNTAEMFYNPHQSIVARKFFKRQKRNTIKHHNNVGHQRQHPTESDNNSTTSKQLNVDQNIFGTNSKVNNTNIHVEKVVRKTKQRNPNIYDDSYDDLTSVDHIPIEKLIKNAEQLKKQEQNKMKKRKDSVKSSLHENNMRSVSQQCTLEYSSETLSDSILNSPDKLSADVRRQNSPMDLLANTAHEEGGSSSILRASPLYYAETLDIREKHKTQKSPEVNFVQLRSETSTRIYVNPCHDLSLNKRVQSRASSVSTSELDELYQQIRRGPKSKHSRSQTFGNERHLIDLINPYFSDTDVNSYENQIQNRLTARDGVNLLGSDLSENNETTV